ncbi:MAG: glycosyltransferase, partial [Acidobacteriota bacterium]|nr:glycosyltransferase [Acidobacteriota bacterium]
REYDLLAVPSQWLETGPLVVLEAFAAGTPVLGSDLGGIAELVRDGVDGVLVKPAGSVAAWAQAMRRLCGQPELLIRLRAGIRPPRHTREVALEMMPVYRNALARDRTPVCQ